MISSIHFAVIPILLLLAACGSAGPNCASAEECAAIGDRVPGGFGSATEGGAESHVAPKAMIDSMKVQLRYYDKACEYNPTGSSCVKARLIREQAIPNLVEGEETLQRLKQLERP